MAARRSAQWYSGGDRNSYIHRAWMRRGLPGDAFDGRPHIAIANTASDLTPCNAHLDEVANTPIPAKLLAAGVRDMVRICDGRMSGTAYGTVVLHVAPEAAAGGPLARVRTGDMIILDVPARTLHAEADLDTREPSPAFLAASPARAAAGSGCTSTPSARPTPARTATS
jgi:dihydroxyacid dehydratase/phosphogluconate dehydratase